MTTHTDHPTTGMTESDVNTLGVNTPPSTPAEGDTRTPTDPPYTRRPARVREGTDTNGSEPGTVGVDGDDVTPHRQPPTDDTESDVNRGVDDDEESKRTLGKRVSEAAERWGLDLCPPKLADAGLPPLNDSRSYADRGDQAPTSGPSRVLARVFDVLARPLRWLLAAGYHVLARPGRTLVVLVLVGLLARIGFVRDTIAFAWALVDLATYWTGLQWLLGLL